MEVYLLIEDSFKHGTRVIDVYSDLIDAQRAMIFNQEEAGEKINFTLQTFEVIGE